MSGNLFLIVDQFSINFLTVLDETLFKSIPCFFQISDDWILITDQFFNHDLHVPRQSI